MIAGSVMHKTFSTFPAFSYALITVLVIFIPVVHYSKGTYRFKAGIHSEEITGSIWSQIDYH